MLATTVRVIGPSARALPVVLVLVVSVSRPALAADRDWIATYIPPGLVPFVQHTVDLATAYNDVTTAIDVVDEILGILSGHRVPTHGEELAALQDEIEDSIAVVLWRVNALDRGNRLAEAQATTQTALQNAVVGLPVGDDLVRSSNTTVKEAWQPVQFERSFDEETTGPGPAVDRRLPPQYWLHPPAYAHDWSGPWKTLFSVAGTPHKPPTRSELENGRTVEIVYDWRLGIPQLMAMISMRIQVIAAADPAFREMRSRRFADELLEYKADLEKHMREMADAVQCASYDDLGFDPALWAVASNDLYLGCADLYSGANRLRRIPLWRYRPVTVNVPLLVKNVHTELRRTLTDAMPFRELRAMIDTLNLLAFNAPDTADGTLVREVSGRAVYIVHGGARFHVPTWSDFVAMGLDANAIQVVADGTLARYGIIPRDGTLLKELSGPEVYFFRDGKKVHVPSEDEFTRARFNWNAVRIVPDGSTSWMPTGVWQRPRPVKPLKIKPVKRPTGGTVTDEDPFAPFTR
jgi:hypothetical protein